MSRSRSKTDRSCIAIVEARRTPGFVFSDPCWARTVTARPVRLLPSPTRMDRTIVQHPFVHHRPEPVLQALPLHPDGRKPAHQGWLSTAIPIFLRVFSNHRGMGSTQNRIASKHRGIASMQKTCCMRAKAAATPFSPLPASSQEQSLRRKGTVSRKKSPGMTWTARDPSRGGAEAMVGANRRRMIHAPVHGSRSPAAQSMTLAMKSYSPSVSKLAFPPAAVVLIVSVRSVTKRNR